LDLLEDAGIPPPKPPIITDDDRAALASMALAQRQFYFVCAFFVGMDAGAAIAYYLGYHDSRFHDLQMGHLRNRHRTHPQRAQYYEAVFLQVPAMRRELFLGRAGRDLLEAMRHLRLAAQFAGGRGLDPVNFPPTPRSTSQREICA
jgi:hypothetical protein